MKATARSVAAVRKVIQDNYWVKDRVNILTKRGYTVKVTKVRSGGIGKLHDFPRSAKLQIGSSDLYNRAFAVIFDPVSMDKAWELNGSSRWDINGRLTLNKK